MRIVLLDLEETVIDNWRERNSVHWNIEKIKDFLLPNDSLGLMSWAVWDAKDLDDFNQNLRTPLAQMLEHPFTDDFVFSMEDISDIILQRRMKRVSREDMFDLFGKEECLLSLMRTGWLPENSETILIDDVVEHGMTFTKESRSVRFINVEVFRSKW